MRHKTTREADEDLIGIYVYGYEEFGEVQAEKYFAKLSECLTFLENNPFVARERTEFTPPVRIHHHGRHLIVFLIEGETLLIVRVLHDSMALERHLS